MARKLLQPTFKNAAASSAFTAKMMGNDLELPGIGYYADFVQTEAHKAADGELAMASRMLAAQAIALDSMFAELARRTANNMGEYVNAAERYGRLALKAQSNCRATLETLAKLHQPREQTVKHFHVNEGRKPWSSIISTNIRGGRNLKIQTDNPTQPARLAQAPRCLARARSGTECQSPAKGGKRRCRMHGGTNPGAPTGNRNAWKHEARSASTMLATAWITSIARLVQDEEC